MSVIGEYREYMGAFFTLFLQLFCKFELIAKYKVKNQITVLNCPHIKMFIFKESNNTQKWKSRQLSDVHTLKTLVWSIHKLCLP